VYFNACPWTRGPASHTHPPPAHDRPCFAHDAPLHNTQSETLQVGDARETTTRKL
jgi:hypothetical protein